jgi:hypothetical protein
VSIRRAHRGPIAVCLILLLLFMQAVTSAYACPQRDLPVSPRTGMEGCEGTADRSAMDPQHPLLCLSDCERNAPASQTPSGIDLPAPALIQVAVAFLPAPVVDPPRLDTQAAARGQPPPGWPPLYLLNLILRN